MKESLNRMLVGYQMFRAKYVQTENPLLHKLATAGQSTEIMIVACCDSRVDPALLLQCEPGDLFTIRNIANIVPPYEIDEAHYGTSAALEFGIRHLSVKHLIVLGHSQCGGIKASMDPASVTENDFISHWTNFINIKDAEDVDVCAKHSLLNSYDNIQSFPWIKKRIDAKQLQVHIWFFDIKEGTIYQHNTASQKADFLPLGLGQDDGCNQHLFNSKNANKNNGDYV